jgi:hypothetical protein
MRGMLSRLRTFGAQVGQGTVEYVALILLVRRVKRGPQAACS